MNSLIPDRAVVQRRLDTLPLVTYQADESVLAAGSSTGRLLILKKGAVAIIKRGIEIAKEAKPGAVFGEISALLDQPHAADVRTLETLEFYIADTATLLAQDSGYAAVRCGGSGTPSRRRQPSPHWN